MEPNVGTALTLSLSLGDVLGVVALLASLVGNYIQWRQMASMKESVYNGLVGVFNGIGWVLGYSISRQKSVSDRMSGMNRERVEERSLLDELGQFATSIDHQCRLLHEQVVAVAKTLKIEDERWQGQFFGMSKDDIDRIMRRARGN